MKLTVEMALHSLCLMFFNILLEQVPGNIHPIPSTDRSSELNKYVLFSYHYVLPLSLEGRAAQYCSNAILLVQKIPLTVKN